MSCRYGLPQKITAHIDSHGQCGIVIVRKRIVQIILPGDGTPVSNLHHPELMRRSQKAGSRILGIARQGNTMPPRIGSDSKLSIIAINALAGTGNDRRQSSCPSVILATVISKDVRSFCVTPTAIIAPVMGSDTTARPSFVYGAVPMMGTSHSTVPVSLLSATTVKVLSAWLLS